MKSLKIQVLATSS